MRVLVAINQLSDLGGTQTYCVDLVHQLSASGHEVSVFCLYSAPAMARRIEANGARLHTYPDFPQSIPDRAIVMHPLPTIIALNRLPGTVPTMAIIHGVIPYEHPARLSRIDRFVAVSPFIRDTLVERYSVDRARIAVIANGIDVDTFNAPPPAQTGESMRILWASSHHSLRERAFRAILEAVRIVPASRLAVVDWNLADGVLNGLDRVDVVQKTADPRELIIKSDVVCAVGPGRIVLEAVAMNRAAICLNVRGRGEYFTESNRVRLEYYHTDWGKAIADLLSWHQVRAHQNQRAVVERHYDRSSNLGELVRQLEALERRRSPRLAAALAGLRASPFVMAEYARLLESQLELPDSPDRARSRADRWYTIARRLVPKRIRKRIGRLRVLQSIPQSTRRHDVPSHPIDHARGDVPD